MEVCHVGISTAYERRSRWRARFHYLARWCDGQRIEHARMFATEGEAAVFDADVKAGRVEPDSRPRRQTSPVFEAEAVDWLATKQATKRAATAARYESQLRLHVLPVLGPVPAAVITRHDVQQWVSALARDNLSASTIGISTGACSGPC
jgi:Phage integrase, N-terminal SAM-like domain